MLKPFDRLTQPDPRFANMSGKTGAAPITAQEHYDWVAEVILTQLAPERVAEAFDRARQAFAYSWFSYELIALCETQAYLSLELALRDRLGIADDGNSPGLAKLIKRAKAVGLIAEDPAAPQKLDFLISKLRNEWAHGSVALNGPAVTRMVLDLCADLIGQLYNNAMVEEAKVSPLDAYKACCERWFGWLDDDEKHSISDQLSRLFWQDAVFRSFNEARARAQKTGPSSAVAPVLARFLDEGYVAGQVIGISKLVEVFNEKQPKKGVVSLRRLVDDLIAHRRLLTRENYLGRDGLPYDFEPVKREAIAKMMENSKGGVSFGWQATEGPEAWSTAEELHAKFDRLSGVKPGDRQPSDLVSEATLKALSDVFADPVFKTITTVRHKSVAHAADAYSRQQATEDRTGLKFEEVDRALFLLLGVKQVVSAAILYGPWRAGAVPTPQQDQFEHLQLPFIDEEGLDGLRVFWRDHAAERDSWLNEAYDKLMP